MQPRPFNLAIETSGRTGAITLGKDDLTLDSATLPHKRRHNVELVPTIDELCKKHRIKPESIGQVYVSLGPGSFTGLRVGITTAKMLALTLGVEVFGIPTLEVLAENAPRQVDRVAVCLNLKRDTVHCAVYEKAGADWQEVVSPELRTMPDLLSKCSRPVHLIGDPLPQVPGEQSDDVTVLPAEYAVGRSEAVWKLGRQAANTRDPDDPMKLVPLYIREPEAVELWNQRHGDAE